VSHVISPHESAPLDDPGFWSGNWRAGFGGEDPKLANPRLARRSEAVWEPFALGPVDADTLGDWITAALTPESWWAVLGSRPVDARRRSRLLAKLNLEKLRPFTENRFGVTLRRTNLRALPTTLRGHKQNDENGFDRLQHTALEPLTPLALLHESADGTWRFVQAPDYRGWVKGSDVARTDAPGETARLLARPGPVLLSPRAELDTSCGATPLQMGSRLPGLRDRLLPYPARDERGLLTWTRARLADPAELAPAYPPLNARFFFARALAPLGVPYGWGGLNLEAPALDCSRFVQDVFRVFGYRLPRDAAAQCRATRPFLQFAPGEPHESRARKLAGLEQGPALLCMPGHVMIYLGRVEGCHHAVHALWSYRKRDNGSERVVPAGRVVVTSLDLGRGTSSGSLLERLASVNLL